MKITEEQIHRNLKPVGRIEELCCTYVQINKPLGIDYESELFNQSGGGVYNRHVDPTIPSGQIYLVTNYGTEGLMVTGISASVKNVRGFGFVPTDPQNPPPVEEFEKPKYDNYIPIEDILVWNGETK